MPFAGFSAQALDFLTELARNNERAWFQAHLEDCERFLIEPAKALVEALAPRLRELDPKLQAIPRVRGSIKSLERRMRFPGAKLPPYKPNLDLWFWSGRRRAFDNSGFFLRLTPTRLTLAAGMIEFSKDKLARYREHVLDDLRGTDLTALVHDLEADSCLIGGESYKRTPRGVPNDHPRAQLLKHSALFATIVSEPPAELATAAFVDYCFSGFARLAPLHAWLLGLG